MKKALITGANKSIGFETARRILQEGYYVYLGSRTLENIWVEPTCMSIDLDHETEYKIVSDDRFFRIEFDKDNQIIFYLQSLLSGKKRE